MQSSFTMAGGVVTLPDLVYQVPGANIALNGTYRLDGGTINFNGKAKMQATVSKMLGGWKGALATPLDGLFKKDGAGTEVGVQIDGTRDDPHFGFDLHGFKHTSPESPETTLQIKGRSRLLRNSNPLLQHKKRLPRPNSVFCV